MERLLWHRSDWQRKSLNNTVRISELSELWMEHKNEYEILRQNSDWILGRRIQEEYQKTVISTNISRYLENDTR